METRTDAQLVAAHLGGDQQALAGIYDRHAAALYDTAAAMLRDRDEAADAVQDVFLVAAERMSQLREASRLRAWLFAILRNEVYRRSRQRRRMRPTDFSAPGAVAVVAPDDPRAEGSAAVATELAESVRAAAGGLDQRDQLVLELSVRRGLAGADLAAALGVTPAQGHVLVHRMRERVSRSLDALAVARTGRKDCPALDRLLAGWDGELTVLIRKRVARHVDDCPTCGDTRRRFAGLVLFAAAPAIAAPPALRALVLERAAAGEVSEGAHDFTADDGFPAMVRTPRRGLVVAMLGALVAVAVLVTAGVVLSRGGADEPSTVRSPPAVATTATTAPSAPSTTTAVTTTVAPTTTPTTTTSTTTTATTTTPTTTTSTITTSTTTAPPPLPPPPEPGRIGLSTDVIDLGAESSSGAVTVTNTGGSVVTWGMEDDPAPFTWESATSSLAPGEATSIVFAIDRSSLAEGTVSRGVTITADGEGGGRVEVRAGVERAPQVRIVATPARLTCPVSTPPFVNATVADESPVSSVVLSWTGPRSAGSGPMRQGADRWTGRLDDELVDGSWSYAVTATDDRGNVGTADGVLLVEGC